MPIRTPDRCGPGTVAVEQVVLTQHEDDFRVLSARTQVGPDLLGPVLVCHREPHTSHRPSHARLGEPQINPVVTCSRHVSCPGNTPAGPSGFVKRERRREAIIVLEVRGQHSNLASDMDQTMASERNAPASRARTRVLTPAPVVTWITRKMNTGKKTARCLPQNRKPDRQAATRNKQRPTARAAQRHQPAGSRRRSERDHYRCYS